MLNILQISLVLFTILKNLFLTVFHKKISGDVIFFVLCVVWCRNNSERSKWGRSLLMSPWRKREWGKESERKGRHVLCSCHHVNFFLSGLTGCHFFVTASCRLSVMSCCEVRNILLTFQLLVTFRGLLLPRILVKGPNRKTSGDERWQGH